MMSNKGKLLLKTGIITGLFALASGCAAVHSTQLAYRCNTSLSTASIELEQAKASGYGRTVLWTKAASLITAAKIQQQSEQYPTCINKTARARYYISRSKQI